MIIDYSLNLETKVKSMSQNPIISVITVVKNGENVIKNCMESIKNQKVKNIEHIIIDGKSNDNTVKIIEEKSYVLY